MLVTMGSVQLEEFYPAVAVSALMRIVRDPSLSSHHTMVIQVHKSWFALVCITHLVVLPRGKAIGQLSLPPLECHQTFPLCIPCHL